MAPLFKRIFRVCDIKKCQSFSKACFEGIPLAHGRRRSGDARSAAADMPGGRLAERRPRLVTRRKTDRFSGAGAGGSGTAVGGSTRSGASSSSSNPKLESRAHVDPDDGSHSFGPFLLPPNRPDSLSHSALRDE